MQAGDQRGPYVLIAPLGAGGMGEVWKARDTRLDRTVAIKFSSERFGDRFEREARAVAALNHPHICTLFDVGPDYLVMEYVEGAPVHGPMSVKDALRCGAQIAAALQAAHARSIVHRDLKPANILLAKSGVKLLDFGLARMAAQSAAAPDSTATITQENTILGTLQYMAPEQLEGRPADARSDIFSFGLVLYELIAGRPAFAGASPASLIAAILKEEPPPLPAVEPVTPPALDRVVRKCLAKDPEARWQSAADLRDELEWIAGSPAPAPAAHPATSWTPWLLAVVMLAIGIVAGVAWRARQSTAPANWSATELAGPAFQLAPRLSPDGSLLAFQTMVEGNTQLAVMKPDGSGWTLLTRDREAGSIMQQSWSPDGATLYYDRFWDQPRGIYSIPALGGQPRLVLENAWGPEVLPDGSLIIAKAVGQGDYQLFHFWPDSGRAEALPAAMDRLIATIPMRAFPDGKEILFYGANSAAHTGPDGLYALDLASKTARHLAPQLPLSGKRMALAATPDGKSAVVLSVSSDLLRLLKLPRDGSPGEDLLLTFPTTAFPWMVEFGRDGSIYVDQVMRSLSALRLSVAGGAPEQKELRIYSPANLLPLSPSEFLFAEYGHGVVRLAIASFSSESRSFLQTNDESGGPMAPLPNGMVAFTLGGGRNARIAVASKDGRILRRLAIDAAQVRGLSASPDGRTLYYAAGGQVWSAPVDGGSPARQIIEGDDVAADPTGRFLFVRQIARDPARLVRVPVAGGSAEPLELPANRRLTIDPMPTGGADRQGRLLVETASPDSYYCRPVLLDTARKAATPIPVSFDGDVWGPVWLPDGRILAIGGRFSSSIWKYQRK